MRSEEELSMAMDAYADMVRRICFLHLKNRYDTEDVFQNVYLKYLLSDKSFASGEHEKAWFARVAINACTDHLRYASRRKWVPLDVIEEESGVVDETASEVLQAVLSLPEKYKNVIYLHYYEDYSAVEIARVLGKKENTVYSWLSRARELLKEKLGGEWA